VASKILFTPFWNTRRLNLCLGCPTRGDHCQRAIVALSRKLRIYIIFRKRGQPPEVHPSFRNFFSGSCRSIWFSSRNFRNFRLNGLLLEIGEPQRKLRKTKGLNESCNGSTRVVNHCTFRSKPVQNKQIHHLDVFIVPTDKWQDFKLKYWFIFEYASPSSLREMFNVARRTSAE